MTEDEIRNLTDFEVAGPDGKHIRFERNGTHGGIGVKGRFLPSNPEIDAILYYCLGGGVWEWWARVPRNLSVYAQASGYGHTPQEAWSDLYTCLESYVQRARDEATRYEVMLQGLSR